MRISLTLLLMILINHGNAQNIQEPIYLNFHQTFSNYDLVENSGDDCIKYYSDPNIAPYFPQNFTYQITDVNKIDLETIDNTDCISVSVNNDDSNCGGGTSSRRSEIAFTKLAKEGIAYYELKFYIPNNFKIEDTLFFDTGHHIFQMNVNTAVDDFKVTPLPPFLIDFEHNLSTATTPILSFNYGLEFRVQKQFIDNSICNDCCVNCELGVNGKADINNQYYCQPRHQDSLFAAANYGWNKLTLKLNWSDSSSGYMDVYLNNEFINNNSAHSFSGPNLYNRNMFPKENGTYLTSHRFPQVIKFGHYRYLFSNQNNVVHPDSKIYFEYFLADNSDYNINNEFITYIDNDINGVLNMKEDISIRNVENCDQYVLLFQDENGNQQYLGHNSNELDYEKLLSILNLDFYTDYLVNINPKFFDGFYGGYSSAKSITLNPDTKLNDEFCDNLNISLNEILKLDKIKAADGYTLYIQEVNNPSNNYYVGLPASGEISVANLFSLKPLATNKEYFINSRARFFELGMDGDYSIACKVMFKNNLRNFGKHPQYVYPNPFQSYFYVPSNKEDKVSLLNISGNKLDINYDRENKKIYTDDLKKGIYFLLIENKEKINKYKIIKD